MSGRHLAGLRGWLWQRLTALYLLVYLLLAAVVLWRAEIRDHADWVALLGQPAVSVATALGLAAVLLHGWIGLRDIVIDYVRPAPLRLLVHGAVLLSLLLLAAWSGLILVRLHA